MIDERENEILIEPERYELNELPLYRFDLVRRDFFKLLGGGIHLQGQLWCGLCLKIPRLPAAGFTSIFNGYKYLNSMPLPYRVQIMSCEQPRAARFALALGYYLLPFQ